MGDLSLLPSGVAPLAATRWYPPEGPAVPLGASWRHRLSSSGPWRLVLLPPPSLEVVVEVLLADGEARWRLLGPYFHRAPSWGPWVLDRLAPDILSGRGPDAEWHWAGPLPAVLLREMVEWGPGHPAWGAG